MHIWSSSGTRGMIAEREVGRACLARARSESGVSEVQRSDTCPSKDGNGASKVFLECQGADLHAQCLHIAAQALHAHWLQLYNRRVHRPPNRSEGCRCPRCMHQSSQSPCSWGAQLLSASTVRRCILRVCARLCALELVGQRVGVHTV